MKVQDFFSVVQLGVGVHAGTAILQLSGEFGIAPVERRIENMRPWLENERVQFDQNPNAVIEEKLSEYEDKLNRIDADIAITKIQFQNLYKRCISISFGFGALLLFILSIMSFVADSDISEIVGLFIVFLCFVPALMIYIIIDHKVSQALLPVINRLSKLENLIRVMN